MSDPIRDFHKLYANTFGYFWLPCPICDELFGGHEASGIHLMSTLSSGQSVCPNCEDEAKNRNKDVFGVYELKDVPRLHYRGTRGPVWGGQSMEWSKNQPSLIVHNK